MNSSSRDIEVTVTVRRAIRLFVFVASTLLIIQVLNAATISPRPLGAARKKSHTVSESQKARRHMTHLARSRRCGRAPFML